MARPSKRRRSGSRSKKISKNALLVGLSCLSLAALVFSLYHLQKEKEKSRSRASISEKAKLLTEESPEAEALGGAGNPSLTPPKTTPSPVIKKPEPTALPTPTAAPVPTQAPLPADIIPVTPNPTPSPEPPKPTPHPTPTKVEPVEAPVPSGPVMRAEPVIAPAPVTELEIAEWQVQLERHHFSSGTIDGDLGMRSKRAITQFQKNRNLPVTGQLDIETRMALGTPGNPFKTYIVTQEDMNMIQPTPHLWAEKAKATYLGYNDAWEMLSEKFHMAPDYVKKLNPGINAITVGTEVTGANLDQSFPVPKADKIQIILHETTLLVYSNSGQVLACFPCSIAADKNKRPNGYLAVKVVAPNPNYTFNPEVLTKVAQAEGLTTKFILPPGPNNPVGLAWIGLTLPGYGMHGTPEPMDISRTGSSGCFRLANWNAQKLMKMVSIGTPVEVVE